MCFLVVKVRNASTNSGLNMLVVELLCFTWLQIFQCAYNAYRYTFMCVYKNNDNIYIYIYLYWQPISQHPASVLYSHKPASATLILCYYQSRSGPTCFTHFLFFLDGWMSQIFARRFHLDIPRHPVTVAFVKGLGQDPLVTGALQKIVQNCIPLHPSLVYLPTFTKHQPNVGK